MQKAPALIPLLVKGSQMERLLHETLAGCCQLEETGLTLGDQQSDFLKRQLQAP